MRYIQNPETLELVPADEYRPPERTGPDILGDIEPFQSPIDGSTISSRSHMRQHMKDHNVAHASDYKEHWANAAKKRTQAHSPESKYDRASRIEAIKHAIEVNR